MSLRKYAKGRVLDEEAKVIDKEAKKPEWTAEDQAALKEENQK